MNKPKSQKARVKSAAENLTRAKRSAAESKERAAPYDVILQTESTGLVERGNKELALSEPARQLTGGGSFLSRATTTTGHFQKKYVHKAKSPNDD